jgi:FMN hydrolase / 5-amino-6-(5-phospho-D-ribitylamino)uracil phosphatase
MSEKSMPEKSVLETSLLKKSGMPKIRALSLDLDDTLWAIAPVMQRAEKILHDWLSVNCPLVVQHYDIEQMRALRQQLWIDHPELQHDYTATRLLSLQKTMLPLGYQMQDVDAAFEVIYQARNQVELFPEVPAALTEIAARVPIIALTNGNADLSKIGIAHFFAANLGAREFGQAKPHAGIFHAAAARLALDPASILHVGDHGEQDVLGALQAGMQAAWMNRDGVDWNHDLQPHYIVHDLAQVLALL